VNPAALINWIISPIDIFSEAVIIPESDSWEISAPVMCSFAIKTLVNLDEHPPQVMPFIDRRWVFSPISSGHQSGFNEFVRCRDYKLTGSHQRKISEFVTTLTEDSAIAAAAKAGGKRKPVNGSSNPIARGIPIVL